MLFDDAARDVQPEPHAHELAVVDVAGAVKALADERLVLKRCGRPEEVVGLVAFPVFERTSFITGGAYDAGGGFTKNRPLGEVLTFRVERR